MLGVRQRKGERQDKGGREAGFKYGPAHLLFYCFANFTYLFLISKGLRQAFMILGNPRCQSFMLSNAAASGALAYLLFVHIPAKGRAGRMLCI